MFLRRRLINSIAGLLVLFFGVIVSAMWISVAFAAIYYAQDKVLNQEQEIIEVVE